MDENLDRRTFLRGLTALLAPTALGVSACTTHTTARYADADRTALAEQRRAEGARSGRGPYGPQRYRGYRGLAELPWFEVDRAGVLQVVDDSLPQAIDFHCHLGMSMLFEPRLDLTGSSPRVRHLLDCDGQDPGCELDLDVYINANFDDEALAELPYTTFTQGLWGNAIVRTHTIPNLLAEMDATRVERAILLPIVFDLPFGDDVEDKWRQGIEATRSGDRLQLGTSVHPTDPDKARKLEAAARAGTRVVKLHPTVQAFYPDATEAMEIYEIAERLGLVIFFHGGRAGIEPESRQGYALPRHYEAAFASFPQVPFVIGHGGARDGAAMLDLAVRYDNVWLGIHGQGVTHLDEMIRRTGGEQLLFGTDWPFYHLAVSLAKVLLVTRDPGRTPIRHAILRDNPGRLLG